MTDDGLVPEAELPARISPNDRRVHYDISTRPRLWRRVEVQPYWGYGSGGRLRDLLSLRHAYPFEPGAPGRARWVVHCEIRSIIRGLAIARFSHQLESERHLLPLRHVDRVEVRL